MTMILRVFATIKQFIMDEPELCGVFGAGIPAFLLLMWIGWI